MGKLNSGWNLLLEKLKQRKILVILGIVIFLILIVLLTTALIPNDSTPISNQQPQLPTVTQEVTTIPGSYKGNRIPKWTNFTSSTFSLQYPQDWSLQNSPVYGGGRIIIIRPSALPTGINYPEFVLETEPGGEKQNEQKISIMKEFGLIESKTTVLGLPAVELKGTMPFKIVGGQTVKQPIQETNILITHGTNNYIFKYDYEGEVANPIMDEFFNGFIDEIKLK